MRQKSGPGFGVTFMPSAVCSLAVAVATMVSFLCCSLQGTKNPHERPERDPGPLVATLQGREDREDTYSQLKLSYWLPVFPHSD